MAEARYFTPSVVLYDFLFSVSFIFWHKPLPTRRPCSHRRVCGPDLPLFFFFAFHLSYGEVSVRLTPVPAERPFPFKAVTAVAFFDFGLCFFPPPLGFLDFWPGVVVRHFGGCFLESLFLQQSSHPSPHPAAPEWTGSGTLPCFHATKHPFSPAPMVA